MRALVAGAVCFMFISTSCVLPTARWSVPKDEVVSYRVTIDQTRTSSGLGAPKTFASTVTLDIDERSLGKDRYSLLVRNVTATGEASQMTAAKQLAGRRMDVDLSKPPTVGDPRWFSTSTDVAASDVAMLFVLLLPSKRSGAWRVDAPPAAVRWARSLSFTVDHRVRDETTTHGLDAYEVGSHAIANLNFHLPLVVQNPNAKSKSDELVVNQLFDALFTDVKNPVQGLTAAIIALPLSILAPFLALGQAIGNLFGSSNSSKQAPPAVDLAGPMTIDPSTTIYKGDGRVLGATATASSALVGQLPALPGKAASLSGKTLHLDTKWTITDSMLSSYPKPPARRNVPLAIAAAVAVLLAAVLSYRMRRVMRPR